MNAAPDHHPIELDRDTFFKRTLAMELVKLDELQQAFRAKALDDQDIAAWTLLIKIAERRATLLGLNAAIGQAISVVQHPPENQLTSTDKIKAALNGLLEDGRRNGCCDPHWVALQSWTRIRRIKRFDGSLPLHHLCLLEAESSTKYQWQRFQLTVDCMRKTEIELSSAAKEGRGLNRWARRVSESAAKNSADTLTSVSSRGAASGASIEWAMLRNTERGLSRDQEGYRRADAADRSA